MLQLMPYLAFLRDAISRKISSAAISGCFSPTTTSFSSLSPNSFTPSAASSGLWNPSFSPLDFTNATSPFARFVLVRFVLALLLLYFVLLLYCVFFFYFVLHFFLLPSVWVLVASIIKLSITTSAILLLPFPLSCEFLGLAWHHLNKIIWLNLPSVY